jgi:chromatin remodeling complex protein RSC6
MANKKFTKQSKPSEEIIVEDVQQEDKKVSSKKSKKEVVSESDKKSIKKKEPEPVQQEIVDDEEMLEEEEDDVSGEGQTPDGVEDSSGKKRFTPTKDSILSSFDEIISLIEAEVLSLRETQNKNKGVKFLRSLNKRLKTLKNHSSRVIKQKNPSTRKASNNNSGFLKPVKISNDMAKFTGWDPSELKSRVDVTKYLCKYIRDNKLQDPKDKRNIIMDNKLSKLLNYDTKKNDGKPLTYYRIQTCIKPHFIKAETA